jgi:calcium-dependent protein kinase
MMAYIAAQVVSREQTKTLTESFKVLDADGNGRLSKMELIAGYKKTMPEMEAEELVQKVMESCDADGSGFIDYSEFIVASMNLQTLLSKQNLQAAFQAFDRDGSGKISMAELKEMLGGVGDGRDSMWKQLISEADLDGDGEIDIAEFSRLMLQATPI